MLVADHRAQADIFAKLIDALVEQTFDAGALLAIADVGPGEPADELRPQLVVRAVLAAAVHGKRPKVSRVAGEGGGSSLAIALHRQQNLWLAIGAGAILVDEQNLCAALGADDDDVPA